MSEFIKFTPEILRGQNISILREIGRKIGVKSSSTKLKDELILNIIKIQNGELEPDVQSKRGAPTKNVDVSAFYRREIVPDEEILYPTDFQTEVFEFNDVSPVNTKGFFKLISQDGYGFVLKEPTKRSYDDVFVSQNIVTKYNIKDGDYVLCDSKKSHNGLYYLNTVYFINDISVDDLTTRADFDNLQVAYPNKKLSFLDSNLSKSAGIVDAFAPIGFGQRAMVVGENFTGKTTLIKDLALSVSKNSDVSAYFVVLLGQSPEVISDFKTAFGDNLYATSYDDDVDSHISVIDFVLNRSKRLVELGQNVVVFACPSSNVLSVNHEDVAEKNTQILSAFKKLVALGRNVVDGASLTIVFSIDKKDYLANEYFFAPVVNCKIVLSNDLASKRVFPAIDLLASVSQKDYVLLSKTDYDMAKAVRMDVSNGKINLDDYILNFKGIK